MLQTTMFKVNLSVVCLAAALTVDLSKVLANCPSLLFNYIVLILHCKNATPVIMFF